MPSHDASIQWFEARKGKVVYSMSARLGPNSYDCSSAVYLSLIAGGFAKWYNGQYRNLVWIIRKYWLETDAESQTWRYIYLGCSWS